MRYIFNERGKREERKREGGNTRNTGNSRRDGGFVREKLVGRETIALNNTKSRSQRIIIQDNEIGLGRISRSTDDLPSYRSVGMQIVHRACNVLDL